MGGCAMQACSEMASPKSRPHHTGLQLTKIWEGRPR